MKTRLKTNKARYSTTTHFVCDFVNPESVNEKPERGREWLQTAGQMEPMGAQG
jgi:hypothetical protein